MTRVFLFPLASLNMFKLLKPFKLSMLSMLCMLFVLFCFSIFAVHSYANSTISYNYQICKEAIEQNLTEAISICSVVANDRGAKNRHLASKKLAVIYLNGYQSNIKPNFKEAMKWLKLAASFGDIEAKHNLAFIYENGVQGEIEKDFEKALKWYLSAAKDGNADSQYNLGNIYYKGQLGISPDVGKALQMYIMAANQGIREAAFMAGAFFAEGLGLEKGEDLEYAYQYFYMASKLGDKDGMKKLAQIERDLTEAQKKMAKSRANKLLNKLNKPE